MLNGDLKYLFTDKSLTTCIMFINPGIFSGGWQPKGKRFPLLGLFCSASCIFIYAILS